MKSIAVILPYFGPFPTQFKFWLQSAYNNPSVDFIFITDNAFEANANVKVINITFDALKEKVQSKFNFKIELTSPYKLCDYRGAYGYIFEEYIKDYDFWGFGDIDLVYGDIRHFLTEEILSKYKIILGWGHFTLYRNSREYNHFFEEHLEGFLNHTDTFSKVGYSHYDEFLHGGMSDRWKYKYPELLWEEKPFDDIVIPRLSFNFKSVFNPAVSNNLILEYSNKNLYRIFTNKKNEIVKEPTLYAHFQQRKFLKVKTNNLSEYLIIPNAYINYSPVTFSKLKSWTKPQTLFRHYWNFKNKVVRRLKMLTS